MAEEKEEDEALPNYAFSALDTMPLVELCNDIYEVIRQRPSLQVPATEKWARKFNDFMAAHKFNEPPKSAIIRDSSEYRRMEREGIAHDLLNHMKDGS